VSHEPSPSQVQETAEALLNEFLKNYPKSIQIVVTLKVRGFSVKEIAAQIHASDSYVRRTLRSLHAYNSQPLTGIIA
jgi:DNA-binding NarL/FixJ family response regulator